MVITDFKWSIQVHNGHTLATRLLNDDCSERSICQYASNMLPICFTLLAIVGVTVAVLSWGHQCHLFPRCPRLDLATFEVVTILSCGAIVEQATAGTFAMRTRLVVSLMAYKD